ncbi:MAG: hypothetical protein ACYS47_11510 [Planctomycetota bacterium]
MGRIDLQEWLRDDEGVGARLSSRDLRGALGLFASDRLEVPRGTAAWIHHADGSHTLLKAGKEAEGEFEAVLVKTRPFVLEFRFHNLLASDDLPFTFTAVAELSVDGSDIEALKDFGGFFLPDRAMADRDDVQEVLLPDIEEAARNYAASHEAAYLARGERSAEIEAALREGLKRTLFEAGLTLREVSQVHFESEEYKPILEAKQRDIIRQAWLKDQKDELLSQEEVKDLVRALEHEGALKELERRREKLQAEKELQALSQKAVEEKLQKSERTASNVVKLLEEAGFKNVVDSFRNLAREEVQSKTGARGSGLDPRMHDAPEARTKRILCVAGKKVLAFRPDQTSPAEVHSAEAGKLGMLRSVRVVRLGGKEVIAAGAQYGVYLFEAGEAPRAFPIPSAGDKRGGVNAVALHKDGLYATHSDYGLLRWKILEEDHEAGGAVRADLTEGKSTCRGVRIGPLDRLFLSAGPEVYSLLPERLEGTPTVFRGGADAVTTFAVTSLSLFAGTAGGEILRWELAEPDLPPRQAMAKRPDPVFMLKICSLAGIPTLVMGSKTYSLVTRALEMDSEVSYPAEARIRWVDGASDYLYGVDRDGRRLMVWEAGRPRAKPMEIRSQERIQDLFVWREES